MLFEARRIRNTENDGMVYFRVEVGKWQHDIAILKHVYQKMSVDMVKEIIIENLFDHSQVLIKLKDNPDGSPIPLKIWETVKTWEERNGRVWPQDAPVWYRTYKSCRWRFALRYEAQHVRKHDRGKKTEVLEFVELIADESGTPPADWREK